MTRSAFQLTETTGRSVVSRMPFKLTLTTGGVVMARTALQLTVTTYPPLQGTMHKDKAYSNYLKLNSCLMFRYIAGRIGIVTGEQSSGLNTFVGTFSLPSLIFLSLSSLNLSDVNWYFLVAVLVSKALVFLSVIVITLLVSRPCSPARSGLYAIFCTQSNDFAIGFPIGEQVIKLFFFNWEQIV